MKIAKVLFVPGSSAFYFDDQKAIKAGAPHDGHVYGGRPLTPGFKAVRVAGEALSILLELEDGRLAVGDCAAVQYSGAGGRDPLFLTADFKPFLETRIKPLLEGAEVGRFRETAGRFEALEFGGERLHTAVRYGLSQALLHARALAERRLMAEVVCEEYGLPVVAEPVPIFGQTGDDRYTNADKMIIKRVDVLPHGLINNVETKLGRDGEILRDYIVWLADRIRKVRTDPAYVPTLHIDVYGTIGLIRGLDPVRVADYLATLEPAAAEFPLYIEGPVDAEEKPRQIELLAAVRRALRAKGSRVKIVADEWCNTYEDVVDFTNAQACDMVQIKTPDLGGIQNTIEAVLYCRRHGMEAYQGGTCNETEVSARACVHAALAARAERLLAKPGMGFDEGFMIVRNEMERVLAVLRARNGKEA
ncbi:MAG: methylaspartate ammonia-lyase [Candidatus Aminicenantes bacterium]|nr:methylaspartate ammonia-lyase [Candidatus Aminicenantes bacterium]